MTTQLNLFGDDTLPESPATPAGFRYQPDLIDASEEAALVAWIATLHLAPYEFQGYLANRNVTAFGYRYSYRSRKMESAPPLPPLLLALREKVAAFAGCPAEDFKQVLVTEYAPGVALGWHRDRLQYGEIVGISLLSACHFKLRRRAGDRWLRAAQMVAPRSAYIMAGEARMDWEHGLPPVDALRYSLTFRTLAEGFVPPPAD